MSSESASKPLETIETLPGETVIPTPTTETTCFTDVDRAFTETIPPSSDDYPTNPTTEHHYGTNIGTGIYNPRSKNVAQTTYTIRESDFQRTAPDSGDGIHARQYHGRELGSIPVGTTAIIHDSSGASSKIEPEVHTRIIESERHLGQRHILHEEDYGVGGDREDRRRLGAGAELPHDRDLEQPGLGVAGASAVAAGLAGTDTCAGTATGAGSDTGPDVACLGAGAGVDAAAVGAGGLSQHYRDLRRDRKMAIANERERITRGRVDTRAGSIHGLFGHGRHRDAPIVGRDTDATDFGKDRTGKIDAHRDVLATSGSEHDRLIGTVAGRERLEREQDAKFCSMLGSQSAVLDRTSKTKAGGHGHEGEWRGTETSKPEAHHAKKPSMLDKIVGNAKAAIGKTIHNPAMKAKGEERAAGLTR